MYFRDKVAYEPLPLPDRVDLPDDQALAAADAFLSYLKKRHSVRDFAPTPVPEPSSLLVSRRRGPHLRVPTISLGISWRFPILG
jgi:hypothetical protein